MPRRRKTELWLIEEEDCPYCHRSNCLFRHLLSLCIEADVSQNLTMKFRNP